MSESIFQEVEFNTSPERLYNAFLSSKEHGAFTGAEASMSNEAGTEFSTHGGHVTGRIIELETGRRIVQAWRAANWEPGVYSLVRIELEPSAGGTKLSLVHSGVPEGSEEHLKAGWQERYWKPLTSYLS